METSASKRCLPKNKVSAYEQFLSEEYLRKESVRLPETSHIERRVS